MNRAGDAVRQRQSAGIETFGLRQCCRWATLRAAILRTLFPVFRASFVTILVALAGMAAASAAQAAASRTLHLKVGAEERTVLLVMPDDAPGPRPVVIALHGAWQTAQSFRAYVGLDAAAAAHGFVVAYPQGLGRTWNDGRPAALRLKAMLQPGDDEAFLVMLAHQLASEGIADPARLYLAGISNGGFMVQKMACHQAQLFAAYVSIMATAPANYREECRPVRPVPILFIHGTADSVITYDGFWTPVGATLSAPDSAALYARLDECGAAEGRDLPDLDPYDGTTAVEKRWPSCRDGAQVALMTIQRGGHQSPARVDTKPDLATPFLGLRSRDIDAGEEIWRFVSAFALPPAPGAIVAGGPLAGVGTGAAMPDAGAPVVRPAGRAVPLPLPSPLRAARAQEPQPAANAQPTRLW